MREETALDFLKKYKDIKEATKNIFGLTVHANYGSHKTYRVADVDTKSNALSTFKKKGFDITYKEYFETAYNIKVKDVK